MQVSKKKKKGQKNKKRKRKENLQRRKTANEHINNKSLCQSLFLPSSIQAVNSSIQVLPLLNSGLGQYRKPGLETFYGISKFQQHPHTNHIF